jgi:hypothetical protein
MSSGAALRAAFSDLYHQSWRLFCLNAALSAFVVPIALGGLWVPAVWALLVLAGPLATALVHCAIVVTRTDELRLGEAIVGLRLHWRRGLALGAVLAAGTLLGVHAISFYAGRGALVLAVLGVYLFLAFGAFQLFLWPLAVAETGRPARQVVAAAGRALLARPVQALALAAALAVVNLVGLAAAVLPFLTLTIAYSALAVARFALPPSSTEEALD